MRFLKNVHYKGVMEVRRALNKLSTRKDTTKAEFYMSVMWMVTDNQCNPLSECTVMDYFEGGGNIT